MQTGWNRTIDGVRAKVASSDDLDSYDVASEILRNFNVPRIFDADDAKSRVFFALFDGTRNNLRKDPEHMTNVGMLYLQMEKLGRKNPNIASYYKEGPGTQRGLIGFVDAVNGGTYQERIEAMYDQFSMQAAAWLKDDPQAKISVVSLGFSRGAEQAAGFTRLVHDRGVQELSAKVVESLFGDEFLVRYTEPPIRASGTIAQALCLYDPVASGEPEEFDRRPPPSVITGFQINAANEYRANFPSSEIIPQGLSPDFRFLGVTTAGAHSDVGGGYLLKGLSNRNFNLMATYLNAVLDDALIKRADIPTDPKESVIHDTPWYFPKEEERTVIQQISGPLNNGAAPIEPIDATLAETYSHTIAPVIPRIEPSPTPTPARGFAVLSIDDTTTAAFADIGRNTEVCRVMMSAAETIQCEGLRSFPLHDTNGNAVGTFETVSNQMASMQRVEDGRVRLELDLSSPALLHSPEQKIPKIINDAAINVSRGGENLEFSVFSPSGEVLGEFAMNQPSRLREFDTESFYNMSSMQPVF